MSIKNIDSVALNRLINLVHVPEIKREFNQLFKKFKDEDYEDFKKLRGKLYKALFLKRLQGDKPGNTRDFYWFELTCYGPDDWRLTGVCPEYDISIVPQYEVLPYQVIQQMIKIPAQQNEIITANRLTSLFWRKVVNVKFCRLSEGFICGTVKLHKRITGYIDEKKVNDLASRDFEMALRKFYYFFLNKPDLIYSFILDFLKSKIPGLKVLPGNEPEVESTETPGKSMDTRFESMKVFIRKEMEKIGSDTTLYNLIGAPKVKLQGQILHLQMEKSVKYEFKKESNEYKARLEQIRRELTAKALDWTGRPDQDPCSYPPLYWFELSEFFKKDWGMTTMKPMPTFFWYKYILSDIVVALISVDSTPPGEVFEFSLPGDGKLTRPARYWVVRLSDTHIVGITVMDLDKVKEMYRLDDKPVVNGLYSSYWLLDRYFHDNPGDIRELVFRFLEAYTKGTFDPVDLPPPQLSPQEFMEAYMDTG